LAQEGIVADKGNRPALIVLVVVVALLVVAVVALRQGPMPSSDASSSGGEEVAGKSRTASTRVTAADTPQAQVKPDRRSETTAAATAERTIATSESEPVQNAISSYHVDDFRSTGKAFEGYKFDGLKQTADGITLADRDPNSSGTRSGVLESPSLKLEFPSNLVGPIWRTKMPEGTELKMEVAVSADGKDWSPWFTCEADDGAAPEPNYPDGRPNPNYGATIGTHVGTGLKLYPYVRYRLTMSSGTEQSPLLQELRLYHVDATAGQGFIAGTQPPPGYTEEPEPALAMTPVPGRTNPTPGPSPTPPRP
jgi:hypothetical protein